MDWKMKLKMYLRLNFLYQFLATFTGLISLFMVGIHVAWPTVFIPKLFAGDPFKITGDEASWIAVSLSIGAITGSALSSLAHEYGRKPIILITSVPYLISPLLLAVGDSFLLLCIARVTAGIATGLTISTIPLYLEEVAHEKIRGALGICLDVVTLIGFIFLNCVAEYIGNLLICLVLMASTTIFVIIFVVLPESPYFLMLTNKYNKARWSLTKFQGTEAVKHYYRLKPAVDAEVQNKGKFSDIFTIQSNRRALGMLCVLISGKQLSADAAIDVYGQTIFRMICYQIPPSLIAALYYVLKLFMVIIASILIDRIDRRPILLVLFLATGLCSLYLGAHFYVKQHYMSYHDPILDYGAVAVLALLGMVYCALSNLPMIMLNELFPANIKHYVSVFFGIYSFACLGLGIKFFHVTCVIFGPDVPFFSYAASGVFHYVLVYLFVFETAEKTVEEVQKEIIDESEIVDTQAVF